MSDTLVVRSRVYRLLAARSPGLKMLVLLAVSTLLVIVDDPIWLSACAFVSGVMLLSLGRSDAPGMGRTNIIWFLVMIFFLGAYNAWIAGLWVALSTVARLMSLLMLALVVMRTTTVTDMMAVVERLLQPLGRLGWVNPSKVALAFGMTLRFLPVLLEQWDEIREAQLARGLRARPHALLVPMLARTLQRAEEVSQALDARGLGD